MIIVLDNILTAEECSELIKIYNDNIKHTRVHGIPEIYPLIINNVQENKNIIDGAIKKIETKIKHYINDIKTLTVEIVKWPENSWQGYHKDVTNNEIVYNLSSVTYLNENFSGGSLQMIDGTKIKPKTGRTVIFEGCKYVHGVEPVQYNDRYTLPIWYKTGE